MRRIVVVLAVLMSVVAGVAPAVAARSTSAPYCGIRWGSLAENANVSTYASSAMTNVRAGRHGCFDRMVVDLGASAFGSPETGFGYQVSYGPRPVDEATGRPLPMSGAAFLGVVVHAAAHDDDYNPTYAPADRLHAVNVNGFSTFRQVAFLSTFERQTVISVGVRARLPFRVFILAGPGSGARLVIDVAHRW